MIRSKFVEDLRESIAEMDEMEQLRIEAELEKQHQVGQAQHPHRDSGVGGDMGGHGAGQVTEAGQRSRYSSQEAGGHLHHANTASSAGNSAGHLKRSAINNSLLDLTDNHSMLGYTMGERAAGRRGSVGSLGE